MNKVLIITTAVSLLSLAGCGDDRSQSSEKSETPQTLTPVTSNADFEKEMKRNLKALGSLQTPPPSNTLPVEEVDSTADGASESSGLRFSTTNVQETGVDESDLTKYDGRYLYVAQQTNYILIDAPTIGAGGVSEFVTNSNDIRILETQTSPASAVERARIPMGDQPVMGLYLSENAVEDEKQLTVISSKNRWSYSGWYDMGYWGGTSSLEIELFDVTNPLNSNSTWSISIDGTYIDSRRIGNKVYVISRYYPHIDAYYPYPVDEVTARNNATVVDALDVNTLLPQHRLNGGTAENHVTTEDCLIPSGGMTDDVYYPYILTVTTLDLNNPSQLNVTCMVGESSGIYASTDALYVYDQSAWNNTVVHKFNFSNTGAVYRASGEIEGNVGWNQPHLRFSEYNDDLRVMTSDAQQTHHLSILRETSSTPSQLAVVATLPNDQQPAPIGKPNEALYGVRFLGERAYAVTFERTDPLYVLDLSNPLAPAIAGELELPGFSDYLQPLGDNLLLGVGHHAVNVDGATVIQGVKVGLFDTTDIAAPQVLQEEIIGKRGTSSAASYDYHALSLLKVPDSERYRLVLPISLNDGTPEWGEGANAYYPWQASLFRFYEIDAGVSTPTLQTTGDLVVEEATQSQNWASAYFFRSVINGDDVHAIYGDKVWSASWNAPNEAVGPQ